MDLAANKITVFELEEKQNSEDKDGKNNQNSVIGGLETQSEATQFTFKIILKANFQQFQNPQLTPTWQSSKDPIPPQWSVSTNLGSKYSLSYHF